MPIPSPMNKDWNSASMTRPLLSAEFGTTPSSSGRRAPMTRSSCRKAAAPAIPRRLRAPPGTQEYSSMG